jgi:hypothetical protein
LKKTGNFGFVMVFSKKKKSDWCCLGLNDQTGQGLRLEVVDMSPGVAPLPENYSNAAALYESIDDAIFKIQVCTHMATEK